ncbi:MAG: hypothetical protein IKI97_02565 [Clostridia bacterium]|nr:hypothetical protein [Clostridia bacterium]
MGLNNIGTLIYIVFAGIIFAYIYTYYSGKVLGGFVRKLSKGGFDSQENTATLSELCYSKISVFLISLSLGESASLRKYVSAVFTPDELAVGKEKGIEQRYYLPKENIEIAEKRYNGENMSFVKLICGILILVVASAICAKIFPYAISMVKGA